MKSYLSHSQFTALENGTYVKRYIFGETFSNASMDFGKRFADAIEQDKTTGDPIIDFGLIFMPRGDFQELKVEVDGLLGYLDAYAENPHKVIEYKTGKTKFTQSKVDKLSQITFYCLLIQKKYGVLPEAELHHLSPEMEITTFKTKRTKKDLKEMEQRIKKAIKIKEEIHELYGK